MNVSPFPLSRAEAKLNRIGGGLIVSAMKHAGKWLPPDAAAAVIEGRKRHRTLDGMRSRRLNDADRALVMAAIETAILSAEG